MSPRPYSTAPCTHNDLSGRHARPSQLTGVARNRRLWIASDSVRMTNPKRTPAPVTNNPSQPRPGPSHIGGTEKFSVTGGYPVHSDRVRDLDRLRPLLHRHPGSHRPA